MVDSDAALSNLHVHHISTLEKPNASPPNLERRSRGVPGNAFEAFESLILVYGAWPKPLALDSFSLAASDQVLTDAFLDGAR